MSVYDPQGGGNVHIDRLLTDVSMGWQNEALVGDVLAPEVRVRKQSDLYYVFGKEGWLPEDDYRAPGAWAVEVPGLTVSTEPYFCKEYALRIPVTDEERENADTPLAPDSDGTELITDKLLLRREQRIVTMVHNTDNFPTAHKVTLSGTDQWNDYANSDPIGDIRTAQRQLHSVMFREGNIAIIPYQVMSQLEDHSDFIERIKYSQAGILTRDIIASIFNMPKIVVPGVGYNSAVPGATESLAYLWGKNVLIAWVPPRPAMKTPAFMYEFVWRYPGGQAQIVKRWREEARGADLIQVSRRYSHKFIAVDGSDDSLAGYLITNAVA
jgi:hypothetical protein